jgi:hypothetical protein
MLQIVLIGFMNILASHPERSPLIHSCRYESAGDRPAWLFVSSMRLTPAGLARKIFPEDFLARLPLKSKSLVQYVGQACRRPSC